MFITYGDKLNHIISSEGGFIVDDTHEFVEKIQEKQRKDLQNKKKQRNAQQANKLPNKRH